MNLYNHKIKNKKAVTVVVILVIFAMFLLRGVLLQNGTIDRMYTLEPDALHDAMSKYEVIVRSDGVAGAGTILDGRKQSAQDENYTLTVVTAAHVAGSADTVQMVLPDGTKLDARVLSSDKEQDFAFLQFAWPEELEVYYSRDILGRLAAQDPAYALKGADHDELVSGTVKDPSASVDGIGEDLILADIGGESGMSGGGLYGKAGNYLGMIMQETGDGTAACIPADTVMAEMKKVLE